MRCFLSVDSSEKSEDKIPSMQHAQTFHKEWKFYYNEYHFYQGQQLNTTFWFLSEDYV